MYWKETKPLVATFIGFVVFTILLTHAKRRSDDAPLDDAWRRPPVDDFYFTNKGFDRERMWLGPIVSQNLMFESGSDYSSTKTLGVILPLQGGEGVDSVLEVWKSWESVCAKGPQAMRVKLIVHAESTTTRADRKALSDAFDSASWKFCFDGSLVVRDNAIEPFERKSPDLASCALFYASAEAASMSKLDHWFRFDVNLEQSRPLWLDFLISVSLGNSRCESFLVKKSRTQTAGLYCSAESAHNRETLISLFGKIRTLHNGHGCGSDDKDRVGVSMALEDYLIDESASDQVFEANTRSRVTYFTKFVQELGGSTVSDSYLAARRFSDRAMRAKSEVLKRLALTSDEKIDEYIFETFFDDLDRATSLTCLEWLRTHGFGPNYEHTVSESTVRACTRRLCVEQGYENVVKQASPSESRFIVERLCASTLESKNVVIPSDSVYVMSVDLKPHAMSCSLNIFNELKATVRIEVPSSDCGSFCATRLKVLKKDSLREYGLDSTCPPKMRSDFYEAYVNDPEMARVDLVLCSYPASNCELFMSLGRPLAVYVTERLELGRFDDSVDFRAPYLHAASPERWKQWVYNLRKIASHPLNSILANSRYDQKYLKEFAGVDSELVPSWCGESNIIDAEEPPREFSLLALGLRDPKSWGEIKTLESSVHPILQTMLNEVDQLHVVKEFDAASIVKTAKAVVFVPSRVSSEFEFIKLYRSNVPLIVPSLKLLTKWVNEYDVLWSRVLGHPKPFGTGHLKNNPNEDQHAWLELADFLDDEAFPHVSKFDSTEHLSSVLKSLNLEEISSKMRSHNSNEKERIKRTWRRVFDRATSENGVGKSPLPNPLHDFRRAIQARYDVPLGPKPTEHPLCRKYFKSKDGKRNLIKSPRFPLSPSVLQPFTPPTINKCSPDIAPGDPSCDAFCPGTHTAYRSDLNGCVSRSVDSASLGSGACVLLTNDACADSTIHKSCSEECDAQWPRLYEKLKWSTSIIAGVCLFGLGAVLGLLFARKHWVDPLIQKYEHEE